MDTIIYLFIKINVDMPDFDEQWEKVLDKEYFEKDNEQFENNEKNIEKFLKLTGIKKINDKNYFNEKNCLDAGCGPGRWTFAMQQLGFKKVDSFDISPEAIKICKKINPNAYVFNIFDLKKNPIYDFVFSWGVLHHTENTRKAFSKVASQVKKGGRLHIMVYDKKFDSDYDGYRGNTCVEKHKVWEKLSFDEKIKMCDNKVKTNGGNIHGWFDAFNPKYNWSYESDEVKKWFEEEGFTDIKLRMVKQNINMNGILK